MTSNVFPAIIKATYDPSGGFPKMVQDAQRASGQIKQQFQKDLGEIGQLAQNAIAIPRNTGGSLDLGVAEYKRAADAARTHAIALREIATAAASAAKSSGDTSRLTQTYIQAASAAAREAEREAKSVNNTAISYERLQAELNKTKSATDAVVQASSRGTTAFGAVGNSLRGMRQASVQSAQQLQDLGISLYSGQRASTVFAQQLPQLAFALTSLEGSTNKTANRIGQFATLLSGPAWSIALVGASIGLGVLVEKLFQSEDAADKASDAHQTLSQKLDLQRNSYQKVIEASREYNAEQVKSRELTLASAEATAIQAAKNIEAAIAIRQKLAAELAAANQTALNSAGQGFGGATSAAIGRAAGVEAQIRANTAELGTLEQTARNAVISIAEELAKINTDPQYAIEVRFDRLRESAKNSIKDVNALRIELEKLNRQEKSALDAQKDRTGSSDRDTRSRAQVLADFRRELESRGVDTISGYRTAAQQNALFRQNLTPADGYKVPSRHQSFRAVDIDKNTFNERAIYEAGQAAGIRGLRILTESGGRKHLDFTGSGKPGTVDDKAAERQARDLERSERAATALQNNLDSISVAVTRIGGEFDRQPRFIDRATLAAEKLKLVIAEIDKTLAGKDLTEGQRKNLEEQRKSAENTLQNEIPRAVRQPFDDVTKQSERELELQNLRLAGREVEAQLLQSQFDLMQRYNVETEEELATALAKAGITKQEYLTQLDIQKVLLTNRNIEQERLALLGQTIEDRISRLNELRESAISTIADAAATGNVSFKNIFDTINRQFADQFARKFFDQFLGGAFQSEEDRLRNLKNRADGQLIVSTTRVADAMDSLAASAQGLATGTPANDNISSDAADVRQEAAIIVSGVRNGNKDFARLITKSLEGLLGEGSVLASDIGSAVSGALEGAQLGGFLGSAFGSGGGKIGRGLGAIIGGANSLVGGAGPLASVFAALPQVGAVLQASSAISSLLGNDQVKGGKTIGVIAPFLTALFGSSLRGSATIGGVNGSLGVTGTRGNSKSRKASATDSANTVIEQINAIAEQLGGGLNASAGSASIGIRKKNFILDPTGQGRTKGAGTINFGKDEKAAIAAARALALDLINDGVITGLRAGSQKLLANAKSLEAGLEKALKFQSVFDRLEAIKNPLGAAVGTLNKEFTGLIAIFKEAGATAEEFAQLEELYGLERQKVIEEQSQALTGSLRQLIEDLKQGENGLALRDRLANIRSRFDPLANTIRGGGVVDYDRFSELARQLIDVQRQISGSQIDYFAVFNEILGLSEQALAGQQNVVSIGSGLTSPFSGTSAPSNASTPVVGAIQSQTTTIVASLAAIQAQIANQNFAPSKLYASNGFSLGGATYF